MRQIVLAVILLVAAAPAHAAKFALAFKAGANQTLRMQSGVAAIDSHSDRFSLRIINPAQPIKKRAELRVMVMNHGPIPFNFGAENFSLRSTAGDSFEVVTYERLVKEEKKRAMWRAIAAGMAAAGNNISASNAGYTSGVGTFRTNTSGTYGSYHTNGTVSWSGYDAGAAQAAQARANLQNQQMFANVADQNARALAELGGTIRTTTVDPGASFGGGLTIELPKSALKGKSELPIVITVTVGDETHTLDAILTPL